MSNKLFVGSLSWDVDNDSLQQAFAEHGSVTEAKVITDRDTGRSRGFGFVTFESADDAAKALEAMDGQDLLGRTINVKIAEERAPRSRGFGGGGFGGGGGGGGGGRDGGRGRRGGRDGGRGRNRDW